MTLLKEGMKAPDFEGVDQNGKTIKLSDFKGKKLYSSSIRKIIHGMYG